MVKYSHNHAPRFAAIIWHLCSYARECGSVLMPAGFFGPQTARAAAHKCTPTRGTVSPHAIQGIIRPHFPLQSIRPPSSWSTVKLSMHETGDGLDLQNFRICTPPLIKTCGGQPLFFPQSMVLGRSSYCEIPWVWLHFLSSSISLSLFLSSLCDQGPPPSAALFWPT